MYILGAYPTSFLECLFDFNQFASLINIFCVQCNAMHVYMEVSLTEFSVFLGL